MRQNNVKGFGAVFGLVFFSEYLRVVCMERGDVYSLRGIFAILISSCEKLSAVINFPLKPNSLACNRKGPADVGSKGK